MDKQLFDILNKKIDEMKKDIKSDIRDLQEEVKSLSAWRWKIYGGYLAMCIIGGIVGALLGVIIK